MSDFLQKLEKKNVLIKEIKFDSFLGDNNQIWSFSFYRLSIIKTLCDEDVYDNFCSIDSDTVTVNSYDDIWFDCKENIEKQLPEPKNQYDNTNDKAWIHVTGKLESSDKKTISIPAADGTSEDVQFLFFNVSEFNVIEDYSSLHHYVDK